MGMEGGWMLLCGQNQSVSLVTAAAVHWFFCLHLIRENHMTWGTVLDKPCSSVGMLQVATIFRCVLRCHCYLCIQSIIATWKTKMLWTSCHPRDEVIWVCFILSCLLVLSFPVLFWNSNSPLVSGHLLLLMCHQSDCLPWFPIVSTCSPLPSMCSYSLRLPLSCASVFVSVLVFVRSL